jgi:hypothetical protein
MIRTRIVVTDGAPVVAEQWAAGTVLLDIGQDIVLAFADLEAARTFVTGAAQAVEHPEFRCETDPPAAPYIGAGHRPVSPTPSAADGCGAGGDLRPTASIPVHESPAVADPLVAVG